jgi:hypothetical protein
MIKYKKLQGFGMGNFEKLQNLRRCRDLSNFETVK